MSGAEAGLFPVAEGERSTGLWPAQMLRGAVLDRAAGVQELGLS